MPLCITATTFDKDINEPQEVTLTKCSESELLQRWAFEVVERDMSLEDQSWFYLIQSPTTDGSMCLILVDDTYFIEPCGDNNSVFLVETVADQDLDTFLRGS